MNLLLLSIHSIIRRYSIWINIYLLLLILIRLNLLYILLLKLLILRILLIKLLLLSHHGILLHHLLWILLLLHHWWILLLHKSTLILTILYYTTLSNRWWISYIGLCKNIVSWSVCLINIHFWIIIIKWQIQKSLIWWWMDLINKEL